MSKLCAILQLVSAPLICKDIFLFLLFSIDVGLSKAAGGNEKFVNSVMINYKGINVWSSPATFAASCDLNVVYWPFDHHHCKFQFGSMSERASRLVMKKINITSKGSKCC